MFDRNANEKPNKQTNKQTKTHNNPKVTPLKNTIDDNENIL